MILGDGLGQKDFLRHLGHHSDYGTAPAIMAWHSG